MINNQIFPTYHYFFNWLMVWELTNYKHYFFKILMIYTHNNLLFTIFIQGEISKAMGQNWFVKSPGCLVFQLQRVDFDRKTGMPVKLNDQFTFEKTIYLDRFLLQNKEEANKINKEISILKERVTLLYSPQLAAYLNNSTPLYLT